MTTLGEAGEFGAIAEITARLTRTSAVALGPGDDAALIVAPDGRVVATTDLVLEDQHFRRAWSGSYDVGRKAAARNLADVAAMGARPTALLVGLAAPAELELAWAVGLADGLRDEAAEVGASVVGGDLTRSATIMIAVTALGDLGGRPPVTRGGARAGDVVALCGRLGWSEAGRAVLARGFRSPRAVVSAHLRPSPPYDAGPQAAELGATAMIDISDGLLQDLGHVARASGARIDLTAGALEPDPPVRDVGAALGAEVQRLVLTGGEDHALAACFPAGTDLPDRWKIIGVVSTGDPAVTVDGALLPYPSGWDHFPRPPERG